MKKISLSFYTNMPTPYQLDFFEELKELFDLHVIYFTQREADRTWKLEDSGSYKVTQLKNSWVTKKIQKKIVSFHFSSQILTILFKDTASVMVVNGTYWSPNVVLALLAGSIKNKQVYFFGEPIFRSGNGLKGWFKKQLLAFPLKHFSDGILGIGKNAVDSYTQLGYKRKIYNLPYNINISLFEKQNLDTVLLNNYLEKWKPDEETILLSSGALIARKGMDTIIKAFQNITSKKARLLILGEGPEHATLKSLADANPNIHFLGFKEKKEVPYYFAIADIFVFASRYDGWGLVINEAMAANNAIICSTEVGAATDKLVNEKNALLVDPDDEAGFCKAMNDLISDKQKRYTFIKNYSKERVELSSAWNAKKLYDISSKS